VVVVMFVPVPMFMLMFMVVSMLMAMALLVMVMMLFVYHGIRHFLAQRYTVAPATGLQTGRTGRRTGLFIGLFTRNGYLASLKTEQLCEKPTFGTFPAPSSSSPAS
jgi:hypothetical protein